jgi:hypothetical protein
MKSAHEPEFLFMTVHEHATKRYPANHSKGFKFEKFCSGEAPITSPGINIEGDDSGSNIDAIVFVRDDECEELLVRVHNASRIVSVKSRRTIKYVSKHS